MSEQIIQAAIVNHERTHVIVTKEGLLPELTHEQKYGTFEDTLSEIGRIVLANVAYVSPDHSYSRDGKRFYQTKPVPSDAEPAETYQWVDATTKVELK